MVDLVYCLRHLLLFDIPLLYYYINLRSSIIFCSFSWDIYLSLDIIILLSIVSEFFYGKVVETFAILAVILLRIQSLVAKVIFWIALFEAVLSASVGNYFAWSRGFFLYLLLTFLLIFLPMLLPIFLAKETNP